MCNAYLAEIDITNGLIFQSAWQTSISNIIFQEAYAKNVQAHSFD